MADVREHFRRTREIVIDPVAHFDDGTPYTVVRLVEGFQEPLVFSVRPSVAHHARALGEALLAAADAVEGADMRDRTPEDEMVTIERAG